MAKGRICSSSRESTPSKIAVRQTSQTERLNIMAQKLKVSLTPCDLISDIDCGNITSEIKETFENQVCSSPEKSIDCHNMPNGKETSLKTTDQEHNGAVDVSEGNTLKKDLGSPSGFMPVSFYGSRSQNATPRIKLFVPKDHKKLNVKSQDLMSDSPSGMKRKSKKQTCSTAVKRKRKTASIVKQSKSGGRKEKSKSNTQENGIRVYENGTLHNVDNSGKSKDKTEPCETMIIEVKEREGSNSDGADWSAKLHYDSDINGVDSVSGKSSPTLQKSAASEVESVCSESSLCSGPGSVLDGLYLRKSGNEYFFSNSVVSTSSEEHLQSCSDDTGSERTATTGLTNGVLPDPSYADQNGSLTGKMSASHHTDDCQMSLLLSIPSPDTSESDFTLKLSDQEAESSSSKSSPEHQASIMRYFKSVSGPKCKTVLIANGASSSSTLPAENSPGTKNRITPKKKKKATKQEQMYLDLGQKDFGHVTCPTCGMVYTRAQPDDEAAHIRHHKSFVSGLRFTGWKNECVVKEYHDGRVIMVSPDNHPLHLKKVEEVRKVVDSELGFVADVPYRRSGAKTFLFITTKKVVGCSVAVQIDQGYPVLPSPGESSTPEKQIAAWCCSTTPQSAQCGISRIWVHSQYRRKKVATRLLDCVRMNFIYGCIIPRELVAFSDPTPDGKRLAKSYAGTSQFLVFR